MARMNAFDKGRADYYQAIADGWTDELDRAFEERFKVEAVTIWDVTVGTDGGFVTAIPDSEVLTPEMQNFITGFASAINWAASLISTEG
jgi:hypothetical protein